MKRCYYACFRLILIIYTIRLMITKSPKFLFVPVSSPEGIGEYMRSIIIATAICEKWPEAEVEFILNKHTLYAADCPFPAHLLDDTPTKRVKEVNDIASKFKPDLVLFDASGRKSQLKHAFDLGAKVVFISQHKRKRSRGMKLSRARVTHRHWVVQPEFVLGDISWIERKKLQLINKPEPIFIGPVFSQPNAEKQHEILSRYQLCEGEFVVFNSGSGGHILSGKLAADIFAAAAAKSYQEIGLKSVMVYGPNYPNEMQQVEGVIAIKQVENTEFINLVNASRFAVLSGGDTLLQAIAINKPTLAIAVSKDQPPRIKACSELGLIHGCDSDVDSILNGIQSMQRPQLVAGLLRNMKASPSFNGLAICLNEISDLLEGKL